MTLKNIKINDDTIVNTGIVYDISEANGGAKYADLADALGVEGNHIPESIRKGGMCVKFIRSSNNRYEQYVLINRIWSAQEQEWEKIDTEYEIENLLAKSNNCDLLNIFNKQQISQPSEEHIGSYQNRHLYLYDDSSRHYGVAFYEVVPGDVLLIKYNSFLNRTYTSVGFVEEIIHGAPVVQVGDIIETDKSSFVADYYYVADKHGYVSVSYFVVQHIEYTNTRVYKLSNTISIYDSFSEGVDSSPTPNSIGLTLSGGVDAGIDDSIRLLPEYLFKTLEKFYKAEDVSNTIEKKFGYYVNDNKTISTSGPEMVYGCYQIPVVKGNLYLFDLQYAIDDPNYRYGGFCFHRQNIEEDGLVDYFYDYCIGVGRFTRFLLARYDGYVSSFSTSLNSQTNYPIVKKINLSENDFSKIQEIVDTFGYLTLENVEPIIKSVLETPNTKSISFMDYLRWIGSTSSTYANNTEPLESGIFNGNVTRIEIASDETDYPLGYFTSFKYGDTGWIDVLKQYQTQDDGVPLELHLKARIYNSGSSIAQTINFGVRYKEGGGWILPVKIVSLNPGEYIDVEFSFTPNYNSLTTIIDSFIHFVNCGGAVLEFGNWDLYVIDPKARDSYGYINAKNIQSGIEFKQLDSSLQNLIDGSSSNKYPASKKNIICSGSSITWGGGALDDSMVKHLDYFIRQKLSNVVRASDMQYSGTYTTITNAMLYGSTGRMITNLNETIEFDIYGDEIAICQMKKRSKSDYGIMEVYANDVLIGRFDNKNFIMDDTEQFSGQDIRTIRLKHPCTFNHQIIINGTTTLSRIVYNAGGYGGTVPADQTTFDAFVFRSFDSNGMPVHKIQFSTELGTITSVEISYEYGHIEAYERNTLGQTSDPNINESYYGEGSTSYDPDHPAGGLSSGMEFRAVNKEAFFIHQFDTAEARRIKIKLVDGNNPYFIINFATNRYHNLMNAGIGGWTIGGLIDNNKVCDYTQFFKWFKPDLIFQESETNDDWQYDTRRISRSIGEITIEQLRELLWLEVHKVTYNSDTDKYAVEMCTGIISSITYNSLISSDIIGTQTQVGDIIRIGNYHGDIKQFACRKLTEVNTTTGEVKWIEPLSVDEMINIDSIDDLVGAEINIRNLNGYKNSYKNFIEKVHEIAPEARIVVVDNGLPMLGLRQLWGYDIIHREIVKESTGLVDYLDARNYLYNGVFNRISGSRQETITCDGSSEYTISFAGSYKAWCGFKVLVDGIDVYGKDCYIQCQAGYHAKSSLSGSALNKSYPYSRSNATDQESPNMKLVFTKNVPSVGSTIEIWFADEGWSGDYCHPSNYGAFLYAQAYASML